MLLSWMQSRFYYRYKNFYLIHLKCYKADVGDNVQWWIQKVLIGGWGVEMFKLTYFLSKWKVKTFFVEINFFEVNFKEQNFFSIAK